MIGTTFLLMGELAEKELVDACNILCKIIWYTNKWPQEKKKKFHFCTQKGDVKYFLDARTVFLIMIGRAGKTHLNILQRRLESIHLEGEGSATQTIFLFFFFKEKMEL